ncbi:MAG: OmpA family protein [Rhodobacteraceae bacterium]|nr:OmpA family protein [Paracoccaceae bacterium]
MVFQKLGPAVLAASLLLPTVSVAQAMTAEEILALLQAQRELLATGETELGDTRALGFVVNSNPETDGEGIAVGTEIASEVVVASTEGAIVPQELVIDLTIFFEYDSALLKSESRSQVDALCSAIQISEQAAADAALMAETAAQDAAAATVSTDAVTPGADLNNADLNNAGVNDEALAMIAESTSGTYQIIGHTDASGSASYNLTLSQARADEVVRYMVRECGIDAALLEAVGMGEGRLKDTGNPRADANRRVEIQVTL